MPARCEPTPKAIPTVCATRARRRLISPAAWAPPVMLEIRKGSLSGLFRKLVAVSIASRSRSGRAWWVKAKRSKPALRVDWTDASRDSRRCSSLRCAMRETGWPFASRAMACLARRLSRRRDRVIVVHLGLERIRVFRLAFAHHLNEVVDDDRIELRPLAGLQLGEREVWRAPLAGGTGRGHGVIGVADRDDARVQRDVLAGQAIRIAAAVVPLVMVEHDVQDLPEGLDRLQDARAQDGVHAHDQLLVLVELALFEQHFVDHADLADVMQDGRQAELVLVGPRELQHVAQVLGELGDRL